MIPFHLLFLHQASQFEFRVEPGKGLIIEVGGVPVVQGSSFQYFEAGWSKGYYSSTNDRQRVARVDTNTVQVNFGPSNGARGSITYRRDGDRLKVHYDLEWDRDSPAKIELGAGLLWAPALEAGSLTASGAPTRALNSYSYTQLGVEERRFSPDSTNYSFTAPIGIVAEQSSRPLILFDARGGYKEDWAEGRDLFWLGSLEMNVSQSEPATLDVEWKVDPATPKSFAPINVTLPSHKSSQTLLPDESQPVLIPRPQLTQLDWKHPVEVTGKYSFPAGLFDYFDEYKAALDRRFVLPATTAKTPELAIDAGISKLGFVPGGFRITITPRSVSVLGEEAEGLRNGLQRVASLAFAHGGKLWLPTGTLMDAPQNEWRGVHLFVGPHAQAFQSRLWSRVLRPLGFNKVVLQCERTAWDSVPGISTPMTMSKPDLVRLFQMYRDMGVEPIPLIESFGHMEWLFANGKNLDLAVNKEIPYTIDPRNPQSQELLTKLWEEVLEALKPNVLHFGLDEVDMRGMEDNPAALTELWQKQLVFLSGLAEAHNVKMMLWGDQALAPGEAPDAAMGRTERDAALRRAAIARGSYIGDWHYLADSKPETYRKVLQLWKDAGMRPIASTWYKPQNIAGFDAEAARMNCGTLQTTWAGYESSEEAMLAAMPQFTAMVLAADYGWSGRTDPPSKLPYDPAEIFRRLYFGHPSPLSPNSGTDLGAPGGAFEIGQLHFGATLDLRLGSVLSPAEGAGSSISAAVQAKGREIGLAAACAIPCDEGQPVAEVVVTLANGKRIRERLVYGQNVRALSDRRPLATSERNSSGECGVRLELGANPVAVTRLEIRPLNTFSGLRVKGLVLVG